MNRPLLTLCALAALTGTASAQITFLDNSFTSLGLSRDGSTMVGQTSGGWAYWTAGSGVVTIGGVTSGRIQASDDGMRMSGTFVNPSTNRRQMAIYDRATSTWTPYGDLGYFNGSTTQTGSVGYSISGDGNTVGGFGYYNPANPTASSARSNAVVSSTPNGPATNLFPTTINNGRVNALNADGTVAGGYAQSTNPGTIWINGTPTNMQFDFGSGLVGMASIEAISSSGRYAAGNGAAVSGGSAYLYDTVTGQYKFAPNPYSANNETAVIGGISDNGRFVAGRYLRPGFNPFIDGKAFVWDTELNTITLLNDMIDAAGYDRQNVNFGTITGMSADGLTFTGFGINPTAGNTSKTIYVQFEAVPEPATMTILALGALAALKKRKRN